MFSVLTAKLFGGVAAAALIASGTLFVLNKDKAAKLDRARTEINLLIAEKTSLELTVSLLETAALERLADHEDLSEQEKELTDALEIDDPTERRRAFVCTILRQQSEGSAGADLPADCGPATD